MPRIEHSGSAVLVVYHSINEYGEDRIRVPNIVTPAVFEAQVGHLASTANIIGLPELVEYMRSGRPLPKKSLALTFDDGYQDNLTTAGPILQKYGVPATFFIASGYPGTRELKWEDQISCLIRRSSAEALPVELPSGKFSFHIAERQAKFQAIDTLVNLLGHLTQPQRQQVLDQLSEQLKVERADSAGIMMTWEDVRQLAAMPGFSIGSHTVSHRHLTRIPLDEAVFEITASRQQLEDETGRSITLFSYPYGDFNQEVVEAVKKAGYTGAGTIEYGQNSIHSDPFRLKRVQVPNLKGVQFKIGMQLRTSALGDFLRRRSNSYNRLARRAMS